MSFETLKLEKKDRIARITFNRPERLNAISRTTIAEMKVVLDSLETDVDIAVVVIDGAGRAFSSGMDLKDDAQALISGPDSWQKILTEDLNFIMRFWDFPKPTIALTHGYCLAAACELAMCCDITIAEEGTLFGEPELKFGSVITAMVMPYLTGPKIAKEFLLTANDRISAERAYEVGLINHVVPQGQGHAKAMEIAGTIALLDDDAVRLTKQAINRAFDAMGLRQALEENLEIAVQIESLETPSRKQFKEIAQRDGLKAALAWREKRFQ